MVDRAERIERTTRFIVDRAVHVDGDVGYLEQLSQGLTHVSEMNKDVLCAGVLLDECALGFVRIEVPVIAEHVGLVLLDYRGRLGGQRLEVVQFALMDLPVNGVLDLVGRSGLLG